MKTLSKTSAIAIIGLFAVDSDATSDKPCINIVVDGFANSLFSPMDKEMTMYREVFVNTTSWGSRYLKPMDNGRIGLYASESDTTTQKQFTKDEWNLPRVCKQDNWHSVYEKDGPNEWDWAILSGAPAVAKCVPFRGTIEGGQKVAVTSPNVYSVGDCAQYVTEQHPGATGVQVGGLSESDRWKTECFAVFYGTRKYEDNTSSGPRACVFDEYVLPGGLRGGTSLGVNFADVKSCINSVKGNVAAQTAQAIGVTYDKEYLECWYHTASEASAYELDRQVHVIFTKPLTPPAKCCFKKCPTV